MIYITRLIVACSLLSINLPAQCPVVLQCTPKTDSISDFSDNNQLFWNEIYWWDSLNEIHDLPEAEASMGIRILDTCGLAGCWISYSLHLDLDADGIAETAIYSDSPNTSNVLYFNNLNIPGGQPRAFDGRQVPSDEKYRFSLEISNSGDTMNAFVRWTDAANQGGYSIPQLPPGHHKIYWKITDSIGTTINCVKNILIYDAKPPEIYCLPGLLINIPVLYDFTLFDLDMIQYTQDNTTPSHLITTAIQKSGMGATFPLNHNGSPNHTIPFDCHDLGVNKIELWAKDRAGNANFCTTYLEIQDNTGNCLYEPFGFTSCIQFYCSLAGAKGVLLDLRIEHPELTPFSLFDLTDNAGCGYLEFGYERPNLAKFILTPSKNEIPTPDPADLQRVLRHLDGSLPFTNPYEWIAADINNDRTIDMSDVHEMEKMIDGQIVNWTNNTTWRFIPKNYLFPVPNPLIDEVPGSITIYPGFSTSGYLDFVAVKVGIFDLCSLTAVSADPGAVVVGKAQPNPTTNDVVIPLQLSHPEVIQLEIIDLFGMQIYDEKGSFDSGFRQLQVPGNVFRYSGMYAWRIRIGEVTIAQGKILRL